MFFFSFGKKVNVILTIIIFVKKIYVFRYYILKWIDEIKISISTGIQFIWNYKYKCKTEIIMIKIKILKIEIKTSESSITSSKQKR